MLLSARRFVPFLYVLALTLIPGSPAGAQGCQDQLHQGSLHRSQTAVSVATLRVPAKAWEHFEKARLASDSGNAEHFERESGLALQIYPNFAEVYILRAAFQVQTRQYEAAIASVAKARLIQPDIAWSGIVLASALTGLHRFDEAVAETGRIHGQDAATWQWSFERTRAEIGRGNVPGALHYSELTLAAAPAGCADTHLLRANAFQLADRKADAIDELETYLSAPGTPDSARAQVRRVLESTRKKLGDETGELLAAR